MREVTAALITTKLRLFLREGTVSSRAELRRFLFTRPMAQLATSCACAGSYQGTAFSRADQQQELRTRQSGAIGASAQQCRTVEICSGFFLPTLSKGLINKYQRSNITSAADMANFSGTASPVGETKASIIPVRHLVLFVVIGQPDLAGVAASEPVSTRAMYCASAALSQSRSPRPLLPSRW